MFTIPDTDSKSARARISKIAGEWFRDDSAVKAIIGVISVIAEFHGAQSKRGTPAQRRKKADSIRKAAIKLDRHIASLDLDTALTLFGRISELSIELETTSGKQNFGLDQQGGTTGAIDRLVAFASLIQQLETHAESIVDEIPHQLAGAPKTPDAVAFGVESLAAIWRKYRPTDPPTSGEKRNSFGLLALKLFTEEPVSASAAEVRTALRHFFEEKHKPGVKSHAILTP